MSFLTGNPAGFSYLSPRLVERATAGYSTGNDGGELRPSCGGQACSNRTAIRVGISAVRRVQFATIVARRKALVRLLHQTREQVGKASRISSKKRHK